MNIKTTFKAFETAFLVRTVETLIAKNYKKGFMRCPTHLSIGQEIVPAILNCFFDQKDLAVSSHRSHAHYLGKRGSIEKLFNEIHGLSSGCSGGKGGSMHLIDKSVGFMGSTAIVGNTIPIGVGLSQAQKLLEEHNLTYIFLGDGATEEGVFYESLNYAAVKKLPCIFIIENNEYSVYTSLKERQGDLSIEGKFKGFNTFFAKNDNHDFNTLFDDWRKAISHCKNKNGPAIVEIKTHRYLEHCGPNEDDQLGYRPDELLQKWANLDILTLLENQLLENNYDCLEIKKKKSEIETYCNELFNKAEEMHISQREK